MSLCRLKHTTRQQPDPLFDGLQAITKRWQLLPQRAESAAADGNIYTSPSTSLFLFPILETKQKQTQQTMSSDAETASFLFVRPFPSEVLYSQSDSWESHPSHNCWSHLIEDKAGKKRSFLSGKSIKLMTRKSRKIHFKGKWQVFPFLKVYLRLNTFWNSAFIS